MGVSSAGENEKQLNTARWPMNERVWGIRDFMFCMCMYYTVKTMGSMSVQAWWKSVIKGQQALGRIGVWYANECRVMAFTGLAIKSVPHWIAHLQCCVLITHGAVVKV